MDTLIVIIFIILLIMASCLPFVLMYGLAYWLSDGFTVFSLDDAVNKGVNQGVIEGFAKHGIHLVEDINGELHVVQPTKGI